MNDGTAVVAHRPWIHVSIEDVLVGVDPMETSSVNPADERPLLRGAAIAMLATALALLLRMVLRSALGDASPFLLFTPAVAIAAIYGGLVPGFVATGLSTILGSHFLFMTVSQPLIEKWDRVILFVMVGSVITISASLLRRSRQQLAGSLRREQKARAAAEAADRSKDDFLALVSHELRTPMTVILGWLSVIRQHRANDVTVATALDAVERNAQIVSRLVEDILDRSRIATGTLRLEKGLISLPTVVEAAVDQMRTRAEAARVRLDLCAPREEILVFGDSIRLQQVFTNLIANAIKFTPAEGLVSVTIDRINRTAQVAITDTGIGIRPEVLPHIFEAFRQDTDTLAHSAHGLGLGLAIARYLIDEHQGSIAAASDGHGRGAIFTVSLPLRSRSDPAHAPFDELRTAVASPFESIH